MDRALKQRLLGAVILTALLVILVPEWLDGSGHKSRYPKSIQMPEKPVFQPMEEIVDAKVLPKPTETTVQQRPQSTIHAWALQIGSFNDASNAQVLRDRMRAKGFPAYVDKLSTPDKTKYRVRIGPELDRGRVDKLKKKFLDEEKIKGMVVKHP